MGPQQKKKVCW